MRSASLGSVLDSLDWRDEALLCRLVRRVRAYPRRYADGFTPAAHYITDSTALGSMLKHRIRGGGYRHATRKEIRVSLRRLAAAGLIEWHPLFIGPRKARKGQQHIRIKILQFTELRTALAGERAEQRALRAGSKAEPSTSQESTSTGAPKQKGPLNVVLRTTEERAGVRSRSRPSLQFKKLLEESRRDTARLLGTEPQVPGSGGDQ